MAHATNYFKFHIFEKKKPNNRDNQIKPLPIMVFDHELFVKSNHYISSITKKKKTSRVFKPRASLKSDGSYSSDAIR